MNGITLMSIPPPIAVAKAVRDADQDMRERRDP